MSRSCYILYHNFDAERHYPYFHAKRWQKYSISNSTKSESMQLKGKELYCILGASVKKLKHKQYFLWNVTDVEVVEYSNEYNKYDIYGKARYLKEPLLLNPIDGFEQFKKTTCNFIGLQNCFKDPFKKVLETAEYFEPEQMEILPEQWIFDFENKNAIKYRESFLEHKKIKFNNEFYYSDFDIEIPKPQDIAPKKSIVVAEPKIEIKHVDVSWVRVGVIVNNAFYGNGEVVELEKAYVNVRFSSAIKKFAFPGAFDDGFLKRV